MMTIKPATEDDIEYILEIEQEAISPPWSHGTLLGELYKNDSFFITAVEDKKICGFAILRQTADESELLQIAVAKTSRRRGAADMLMNAVLARAAETAKEAIHLEVRRSNEAAINLYKKYDFKIVRYRKGYYTQPVEDAVVMIRRIIK